MTVRTKTALGIWTIAAALALASLPLWRAAATPLDDPKPQDAPQAPQEKDATPDKTPAAVPPTGSFSPGDEKLRYLTFVSTDKPIYRGGEKVYIRGLLLHHAQRTAMPGSTQGHVEITGPKGDVILNQTVTTQDGAWGTAWEVPSDMAGGQYTAIISYPLGGMPPAERSFDIRQYRAPRLKSQIKFVRDGYGPGDEVAATLEVERAEGGVPADAPVDVTARVDGEQVFQGQARVGADGRCVVRFPLPDPIQRGEGTLSLAIHDGGVVETAAKTIPILLQSVDIELYPEGGDLVQGLPSRVYFEAVTPAGKPADLAGEVIDDRGKKVAEFRSEHEGRGRFELTPRKGRSYQLRFTEPAGITQRVTLPEAKESGLVLRSEQDVYDFDESIRLTLGGAADGAAQVVVRQREKIVASKSTTLVAGRSQPLSLSLGDQPHADGVLMVTAYDADGRPRAERLVFRRPRHQVRVKITPESTTGFIPGGKVRLKVETTDEQGKPISALIGLTVTDESVLEMIDKREQTASLPVMVLLENEVDELADAHVYLDPNNKQGPLAVDLLLGVQGWRRWALVDPQKWIAEHGDAGRRALAQAVPTQWGHWGGFGFGGGGAAFPAPPGGPFPAPVEVVDKLELAIPAQNEPGEGRAKFADQAVKQLQRPDDGVDERDAKEKNVRDERLKQQQGPAGGRQANGKLREQAAKEELAKNRIAELQAAPALEPQIQQPRASRRAIAADLQDNAPMGFLSAPPVSVRVYAHQVRSGRKAGERIDFTETLFWSAGIKTNDKGLAEVEFGLSDSVTTFQVRADAVDGRGGLGYGEGKVESVEPFYLEPKLPLEVTMGDMIQTPLGVVNATGSELGEVRIDVETQGLDGNAKMAPFVLGPGQRLRKRLNIHVGDFVGEAQFKVTSTAGDFRDQVVRTLRVAPLGFPYEEGGGALLTPGGIVAMEIDIPKEVVPGSVTAGAMVFPTPLATMTASLERLIREPNGCFEQTSSTTYPLVMAQQYFMSHQDVDPELVRRSADTLGRGYERLLGFESPSGGFEWFGSDPGHDALTAYGLLEFTDMSQVRAVDSAMLDRTRSWLLKQRDGKGGYLRKTHTLHTWLADPEVAFTYNTWSLLEAGAAKDLSEEVKWVAGAAQSTNNSYVLALAANVLALGGDKDGANQLLDKLSGLQAGDGSVTGGTVSVVGSGGEALTIETTALAMLAWLRNPSYTDQVEKGIHYLADVCKGGRFGSTQSTVLALRGIVAYDQSRAKPKSPGAVSLWVDGSPVGEPMKFDNSTHGSIVLPDYAKQLTPGKHQVELRMENGSEMPCIVNVGFHTLRPPSSPDCQLHLEVKLNDDEVNEGAVTEAEVVVVNRSEQPVPTPTAIIGIPGGLEVRHDQLKESVKQGLIAAYEVRGREVVLYWRVLDGEQRVRVPLSLVAAVPGVYTAPASRAYLYYTDEHKDWVGGLQVTIVPAGNANER